MSDKRRAEIEAKRAKLNELKKARAERQKAENEKKRQEVGIEFIKLSVQYPSLFIITDRGPFTAESRCIRTR